MLATVERGSVGQGRCAQPDPVMRLAVALAAVLIVSGPARADVPCVTYGPHVSLTGTIHRAIAFGPPGYGTHPKTDAKEIYESLSLDEPLCVLQGDDETEPEERGIRQVELDKDNGAIIAPDGSHMTATGELYHKYTAHHHTKVLLGVDRID